MDAEVAYFYKDKLYDFLAVLHKDGGHYTERVGLDQSIKDAVDKYLTLVHEKDLENN